MMKSSLKTILLAGLVAGILDAAAAVIILGKLNFTGVWKYVASGYFGNEAFTSGNKMVFYGLIFHFCIALFWAAVFYLMFSKLPLFRAKPVLGGLLFGVLIWLTMAFLVLPNTNVPKSAFNLTAAIKNQTILMVCVGLPISMITNRLKGKLRNDSQDS